VGAVGSERHFVPVAPEPLWLGKIPVQSLFWAGFQKNERSFPFLKLWKINVRTI
jgi:hypothetical protein